MHRLVRDGRNDPQIIYLASRLARLAGDKDYAGQAERIFRFVRDHIAYTRDPIDTELLRDPIHVLYYGAGDCDDQAVLFSGLAQAIGMRTRFKTIKADPSMPNEYSHVYSQVLVPGTNVWQSADTIVKKPLGWEAQANGETWEDGVGMRGLGSNGIYTVENGSGSGAKKSSAASAWDFAKKLTSDLISAYANKEIAEIQAKTRGLQVSAPAAPPSRGFSLGAYAPLLVIGGAAAAVVAVVLKRRKK